MIKNRFYTSALLLFLPFSQIFGITKELKEKAYLIRNEFFTPGQSSYMDTLGNLWDKFKSQSESFYQTVRKTEGDKIYLLTGFCSIQTLLDIIFKCEEFKSNHYKYIFHSLRFKSLEGVLLQISKIQDFASPQYSQLIETFDLLIARIQTAGLINEANNFFEKLTILVSPDFLFVPRKQNLSVLLWSTKDKLKPLSLFDDIENEIFWAAKSSRLKFLQNLTFSLVFFALTIERGLFNGLTESKKTELSSFINELINQAYPLD